MKTKEEILIMAAEVATDPHIVRETEKAVLLTINGDNVWFPRAVFKTREKFLKFFGEIKKIDVAELNIVRETEKAIAISVRVRYEDERMGEWTQYFDLWLPKSLIKEGAIPLNFLKTKAKELIHSPAYANSGERYEVIALLNENRYIPIYQWSALSGFF